MLKVSALLGGLLANQAAASCEVCYEGAPVPIVDGMGEVSVMVYSFFSEEDPQQYLAPEFELSHDDLVSVSLSITHGGFESTFKEEGSCDFNGVLAGQLCQEDCTVLGSSPLPLNESCVEGDNEIRGPDNNADWIGAANGMAGEWTFSVMSSNSTGEGNITGFCVVVEGIECRMFDALTPPPSMAPTMQYLPVDEWCSDKEGMKPTIRENFTIEVDADAAAAIMANPDKFYVRSYVEHTFISDLVYLLDIHAPMATMSANQSMLFFQAACNNAFNVTIVVSDMFFNHTLCYDGIEDYDTDMARVQTLNMTFTDYFAMFDSLEGTWMITVNDTYVGEDNGLVDNVCIGVLGTRSPTASPTMTPDGDDGTTTEEPSNANVFSAVFAIATVTLFSVFAQ